MKKYLETDESVKKLKSREELWEYLKFRKENDEWLNVFINEMAAVGIKNEPLFIPQRCSNLKIKKNGYTMDIPDIDYEKTENEECIKDTGLFLVFPYKNIRKRYSGETKIIKLPPSSRVKNWMVSPKNDPLPKEEQHPQAELQRQNDEMFWHMIQNCRF